MAFEGQAGEENRTDQARVHGAAQDAAHLKGHIGAGTHIVDKIMADHGTKNQRSLNLDAVGDHTGMAVAEARADERLGERIDSEVGGQVDVLEDGRSLAPYKPRQPARCAAR